MLNLRSKRRQRTTFLLLPDFFSIDPGDGQLNTSVNDKRDDFNFHITNFSFLSRINLGPTMAFLSHSLYDIHRLAPHIDVLF